MLNKLFSRNPFKRGDDGYKVNTIGVSAVISGVHTITDLITNYPPSSYQAKYAFVTNLGGGADMVLSDGINWKHIRQGVVTSVPATSNIVITPLASPPIIQFSGTNLSLNMNINVSGTNLYVGYQSRLIFPSGVLAATSTVGLSLNGGTPNSLTNILGYWLDVQYNGSTLVEISKGLL